MISNSKTLQLAQEGHRDDMSLSEEEMRSLRTIIGAAEHKRKLQDERGYSRFVEHLLSYPSEKESKFTREDSRDTYFSQLREQFNKRLGERNGEHLGERPGERLQWRAQLGTRDIRDVQREQESQRDRVSQYRKHQVKQTVLSETRRN